MTTKKTTSTTWIAKVRLEVGPDEYVECVTYSPEWYDAIPKHDAYIKSRVSAAHAAAGESWRDGYAEPTKAERDAQLAAERAEMHRLENS